MSVSMEDAVPSQPFQQQQGPEASASPLLSSPLKISLSFKNGEPRSLERFFSSRTRFETPDAERAELYKVFLRFDKDGDGKLTVEEIRASLEKLGVIVSTADLALLLCVEAGGDACKENGFTEDANGHVQDMHDHIPSLEEACGRSGSAEDQCQHTGYLDFAEFYSLYRSLCLEDNEGGVICTPNGKISDSNLRSAFDLFDQNHDTFISVTELQSVLISLGFKEASSLDECKSMVATVDSDGDGMVSFEEFKAMMRSIKEDQ